MAKQMHAAWVQFAKSGDPNTAAIPAWPRYDTAHRNTMIFNLESHAESDPLGKLRELMLT
jgi:para-nitrobenzyl esterase